MKDEKKTMNKILEKFEFINIRERFYETHETNNKGWAKTHVKVFDRNSSTTEPIYEYDRNYSMLKTFDPFRVWDDEKETWRHMALISPSYMNFEVLDLDENIIIAKKLPTLLSKEKAESLNKSYIEKGLEPPYTEGQNISSWNFCPSEFHVPDVYDILDDNDIKELQEAISTKKDLDFWQEWMNNFINRRTFAFEAGCVWGDDWSYKVQAIDLTKILQGEVQDDDRFGYLILQGDLKNIYNQNYFDDEDYISLELSVPIMFQFDRTNHKKVTKSQMYSNLPNFQQ